MIEHSLVHVLLHHRLSISLHSFVLLFARVSVCVCVWALCLFLVGSFSVLFLPLSLSVSVLRLALCALCLVRHFGILLFFFAQFDCCCSSCCSCCCNGYCSRSHGVIYVARSTTDTWATLSWDKEDNKLRSCNRFPFQNGYTNTNASTHPHRDTHIHLYYSWAVRERQIECERASPQESVRKQTPEINTECVITSVSARKYHYHAEYPVNRL